MIRQFSFSTKDLGHVLDPSEIVFEFHTADFIDFSNSPLAIFRLGFLPPVELLITSCIVHFGGIQRYGKKSTLYRYQKPATRYCRLASLPSTPNSIILTSNLENLDPLKSKD